MTERRFDEVRGLPEETGRIGGFWSEVSWPAIVAGTFVALAIMVFLWSLGRAVGLSINTTTSHPWVWGIWSLIVAIVAFFIGGWSAARISLIRGYRGALNGLLVAAVAITLTPLLLLGLGTTAVGRTVGNESGILLLSVQQGSEGTAMTATTPDQTAREQAHSLAVGAWWGFAGLLLALAAAGFGGYAGVTCMSGRGKTGTTTTTQPPNVGGE